MRKLIVCQVRALRIARFAIAVAFASISAMHPSFAQQITSDVVISNASLNDGYIGWMCDDAGQLYRRPSGRGVSVMRVAPDGSTRLFTLPEPERSVGVFAPIATGLAILNTRYVAGDGLSDYMYRFDGQGKTSDASHCDPRFSADDDG